MNIAIIESDGWGALYVDGNLETVGPTYHLNERMETLLKVERTHFDDFAFDTEEDFPKTLDAAFRKQRKFEVKLDEEDEEAEAALSQADALEERAAALRERYSRNGR